MNPNLIIQNYSISWWGIIGLSATLFCWILFYFRNRKLGHDPTEMMIFLIHWIPVGFIGAYLTNWLITNLVSETLTSQFTGMTVAGTLIPCLIYVYIYAKYKLKVNPLKFMDDLAFTFPLSIMIGRVACLLVGCCFGQPVEQRLAGSWFTLPAGVYQAGTPAALHYEFNHIKELTYVWNLPLLLILSSAAVLLLTEFLYRHKKHYHLKHGSVFLTASITYTLFRFLIEFTRAELTLEDIPLNPWQLFVFILGLLFTFLLIQLIRNKSDHKIITV